MIMDEVSVETKIDEELRKLKYNNQYRGTQYLKYTIYILYKMNNDGCCDLKSKIYPIVAQKYNSNVNNVKCDIRNATDKMYYDCEQTIVTNYIGCNMKPTPKIIIKKILKEIRKDKSKF